MERQTDRKTDRQTHRGLVYVNICKVAYDFANNEISVNETLKRFLVKLWFVAQCGLTVTVRTNQKLRNPSMNP